VRLAAARRRRAVAILAVVGEVGWRGKTMGGVMLDGIADF
jgi:hypothetical protein